MKVVLLLLLASASTGFGKSLVVSNLLQADVVSTQFHPDESEADPDWTRESDSAETRETDQGDQLSVDQEEQGENLFVADELLTPNDIDNDGSEEDRFGGSDEQDYYDHYDRDGYLRYDFNPFWRPAQEGAMIDQPIVIPVQFVFGKQDNFRRGFVN